MADDLTTFLHSVESRARKILQHQNKRQQQEAVRARVALIKGSTTPTEAKHRPSRDNVRVTSASGGALILSAPAAPRVSNQRSSNPDFEADDTRLPQVPPLRSPVAFGPLGSSPSPLRLPAVAPTGKGVDKTLQQRSSALKLLESPLYKSLTGLRPDGGTIAPGKKLQKTLQSVDNVALLLRKIGLYDPIGAASPAYRADHAVDKRMCTACWTTPEKKTGCEHHARVYPTGKSVKRIENEAEAFVTRMELQGPTSWQSGDLNSKYRSEKDRENLWSAYLELQKHQQAIEIREAAIERDQASLAVIPHVTRHPVCALLEKLQSLENLHVRAETRKRNLTKTFVFDVNHIWLTNLDHFNLRPVRPHVIDGDGDFSDPERYSLSGRRDHQAIREGYSQIQSISTERALQHAVTIGSRSSNCRTNSLLLSARTDEQRQSSKKTSFHPLSLGCCGKWNPESHPNALEQVPGVALVGNSPVLWWRYDPDHQVSEEGGPLPEYTKTVALFERNSKLSSSDSITVTLVLALDAPVLAPKCFAWHVGSKMPRPELEADLNTVESGMNRVLPKASPRLDSSLSTPLESILDELLPSTITLLSDKAQDEDIWLQPSESVGYRRGWSEFSPRYFFRQWLLLTEGRTLTPHYAVETQHCSVTVAHPNAPGVCGRYCWHEIDPVKKLLSRRFEEKDFLYMLQNHSTSGSNDASYFIVNMNHESMRSVIGARLSSFLAAVAEREARVAYETKVQEIEQKLEIGRLALEAKRQEQKRLKQELEAAEARAEIRSKGERKNYMDESVAQEWNQRLAGSIIVEQNGCWEMREITMNSSGVIFYHSLNDKLPLSRRFLWEQPKEWGLDEESDEKNEILDNLVASPSNDSESAAATTNATNPQVKVEAQDELVRSLLEDEHFLQQLKAKLGLKSQSSGTVCSNRRNLNDQDEEDETNSVLHKKLTTLIDEGMDQSKFPLVAAEIAKLQLQHAPQTRFSTPQVVNRRAEGWKRLKTSRLPPNFARKVYRTHTEGPRSSFINQTNHATLVGMLDPAECSVNYVPDLVSELRVLFVPRPSEDLHEKKMQWTQSLRAHTLPRTPSSRVLGEDVSIAKPIDESFELESSQQTETKEQCEARALLCARNSNLEGLELALDQGVGVNTRDEHGNTLLILACQQGDKRLAKFLLRRRADMNLQNLNGNTAMHYLYAYQHKDLAEYLKTKGAKDTTQNTAGLTCYEGLSQDDVDGI